jgi:pyrimidine operon attenuation protein/uracil phosphoribosyltransferase
MVQAHTVKATILDGPALTRAWRRIAHEVIERQPQLDQLVLVGIVTRGVPLAARLARQLQELEGVAVPIVPLDVRAYRDDLPRTTTRQPEVPPELIQSRPILLVDDVLYHGRTIRGHRELPIRPDYVGKNVPTAGQEWIEVHLDEVDGEDAVRILERKVA